jgi:phosphatidylglycerophosphatase A
MNAPALIGTFFGVGYFRPAPGTWGSAAAMPFIWLCLTFGGFPALSTFFLLSVIVGWWATARYVAATGKSDPGEIVIDEVAGQALTLLIAAPFVRAVSIDVYMAAFILFRVFDIVKVWPASWADRELPGAAGVMIDDLIAGIYGGVILIVISRLI